MTAKGRGFGSCASADRAARSTATVASTGVRIRVSVQHGATVCDVLRRMEVIIRPTAAAAAGLVARLVANDLHANPRLVLGLATGRTMERVYERLPALPQTPAPAFS